MIHTKYMYIVCIVIKTTKEKKKEELQCRVIFHIYYDITIPHFNHKHRLSSLEIHGILNNDTAEN